MLFNAILALHDEEMRAVWNGDISEKVHLANDESKWVEYSSLATLLNLKLNRYFSLKRWDLKADSC